METCYYCDRRFKKGGGAFVFQEYDARRYRKLSNTTFRELTTYCNKDDCIEKARVDKLVTFKEVFEFV